MLFDLAIFALNFTADLFVASTFTDVVSTNVSFASFTEASSSPSFAFALAVSSFIALDNALSAVAALVDSLSRFVFMLVSSFSALVVSAINEASSSPSFSFALAISLARSLLTVSEDVPMSVTFFSIADTLLVSSVSFAVALAISLARSLLTLSEDVPMSVTFFSIADTLLVSSVSFAVALAISLARSLLTLSEDVPMSVTFFSIADTLLVSSVSFAVALATSAFTSLSNCAIEALFASIRFVCSPSFAIDLSISASSLEETSFICLLETYKAPLSLTIMLSS